MQLIRLLPTGNECHSKNWLYFIWVGQSKISLKGRLQCMRLVIHIVHHSVTTYNTKSLEGEYYNRGCGFSQVLMSRPFFCSPASNIETQLYEWKVIVINDNTWIDGAGGDEAQEWFRVSFHGALCDEQRLNPSNHRQQELLTSRVYGRSKALDLEIRPMTTILELHIRHVP